MGAAGNGSCVRSKRRSRQLVASVLRRDGANSGLDGDGKGTEDWTELVLVEGGENIEKLATVEYWMGKKYDD
jgi:hypothetical protein